VALANLEIFKKERTLSRLAPKIKFLGEKLKMLYNLRSVTDVRQMGFMAGIELKGRLEDRVGAKVCERVRKYGVILRPLGNVIVLMPPLSITVEELDYLLMATYRAIEDITNSNLEHLNVKSETGPARTKIA
jgi:adenosylmethionine-8-amino-7-oxononanoate aminotransferase